MRKVSTEKLRPILHLRHLVLLKICIGQLLTSFLLIKGTLGNCTHHKESYVTKY